MCSSDLFNRQARDVMVASDQAQAKVGEVERVLVGQARLLTTTSEQTTSKAIETADIFRRQAETLVAAASNAQAQAMSLTSSEIDARRGSFLRASRVVIESLNSLGIDFSRSVDPSATKKMLPGFLGGDRGIFTRWALKQDFGKSAGVLRERFETDPDFRKYVLDYMSQFEKLVADAKDADPEQILSATFLTADIGKLYMVLSEIFGQIGRAHV